MKISSCSGKRLLSVLVSVLLLSAASARAADDGDDEDVKIPAPEGSWFFQVGSSIPEEVDADDDGVVSGSARMPNSALLYFERKRENFRPTAEDFAKDILTMEVKAESSDGKPVSGNVFVKDKDGLWFQSRKTCSLAPGAWQKIETDLKAASSALKPEGHSATWSCLNAAMMLTAGFKVSGTEARVVRLSCRNLEITGKRTMPPLQVLNLSCPDSVKVNRMIEGSFELSREYFNPFDAEEIKVDVQFTGPEGEKTVVPAYFTQPYVRQLSFNREMRTPTGKAHWAFRFTPQQPGKFTFAISASDSSGTPESSITTPPIGFTAEPSEYPGFVRTCRTDNRYFELSTGEFFYPTGFNIHSVKDTRSETQLKLGTRPDKGTFAYDDYFSAMSKNGINAVEVWMAAWSFALEWTSSRTDYYGLGRYNLFNAWRLDHVLDDALAKGIYVHLVLDNHGKLSSHCDPEWDNSPYNKKIPFAAADGAMLDRPVDFFGDAEAERHYRNRNRYIAGRWGAYTNIFGVEFWSEIDLITNLEEAYRNEKVIEWHRMAADHFASLDQGKHLLTTHTCGDYNNPIKFRKFYELPQLSYVVGDAYRDNTPFVEHMLRHTEKLKELKKPLLITEYGGSPQAGTYNRLEADLHAGIWSSFFCEQAGTPFLWWHDFIHDKDKYPHFKGFSMFMKGVDPRNKGFAYVKLPVSRDGVENSAYSCLAAGNRSEYYAWVFKKAPMENYPDSIQSLEQLRDHMIVPEGFTDGSRYAVSFQDTLTGDNIWNETLQPEGGKLKIRLPPFRMDMAIKILVEARDNGQTGENEGKDGRQ